MPEEQHEDLTPKRSRRGGEGASGQGEGASGQGEGASGQGEGASGQGDNGAIADNSPVIFLGQYNGYYFFLSWFGEFRQLDYRAMRSDAGLISLFDGNLDYLIKNWPRQDRDGNRINGEFNAKRAYQALVRLSAEAGQWDPETPIRGRGVWPAGDGRLLCHAGNRLHFSDGATVAAGQRLGGPIYPRKAAVAAPAPEPLPAAVARQWRDDFRWWRFRAPDGSEDASFSALASELLAGACALAMLGAAPLWRVHVAIKAVHGAGKSTLVSLISASLGPQAMTMNNFSEAGLRNSLSNEARAVLLDEAEGEEGGVMNAVIRVLRQMSGGAGLKGARGDVGGGARHFEIAGCAFLFCINPPELRPQDLSRILVLDMQTALPAHERQALAAVQRAAEISPGLRARALYGWQRFEKNLVLLRGALRSRGCNARQADQLGALFAAAAMMTEDAPIDARDADDIADRAEPLITMLQAESEDRSDARGCWLALLSRSATVWRGGEAQTISALLLSAQRPEGSDSRGALNRNFGLRLQLEPTATFTEAPCLYVAGQHQFLREVYRDTVWREGGWRHSLVRLDGAQSSRKPVRIGGVLQRAVAVPLKLLPKIEEANGDEPGSGDDYDGG